MAAWKKLVAEASANTIAQNTTGSAATLTTARTITLGTDLSGNVSFDGSANVTLNASLVSNCVGDTELDAGAGGVGYVLTGTGSGSGIAWALASGLSVASAATLTTARAIALGGVLSGTADFNGSAGISITASYVSDSVGAAAIDVTGNGNAGDLLASDGAGGFNWASPGGTGTVTQVNAGNGMDFTQITTTGSVVLGTPSALSASTTDAVTANSHTHSITASASPGAAASILKTTASGGLTLASLSITGDLTVAGTVTSLDTTNLQITDNVIMLNALADNTNYADSDSAIIFGNSTQAHGSKLISTDTYVAFTELVAGDMPSGTLPSGTVTAGNMKTVRCKNLIINGETLPGTPTAGQIAFDGTNAYIYV